MKVFISWSGPKSKKVALALHTLLPDALQGIKTWMSDLAIDPGSRWSIEVSRELENCNFGIICLTPKNINSPWILFEAGCLSKSVTESRVVPYLIGINPSDVTFPLAQFQSSESTKDGTLKLINSINKSVIEPIKDDRVERIFQRWWPDMERQLLEIQKSAGINPKNPIIRDDREILEEILQLVRQSTLNSRPPLKPNYSDILSFLKKAKSYHTNRHKELKSQESAILADGQTPSGMYDDYAAESLWVINQIDLAVAAFTTTPKKS